MRDIWTNVGTFYTIEMPFRGKEMPENAKVQRDIVVAALLAQSHKMKEVFADDLALGHREPIRAFQAKRPRWGLGRSKKQK